MGYSSDSSDIPSDYDSVSLDDYKDYEAKIYSKLQNKEQKVKYSNGRYRCPFCISKKKVDYYYNDLLQHATGIAASTNRKAKLKVSHQALSKFLKNELSIKDTPAPSLQLVVNEPPKQKEVKYVWPWMGILVNMHTELKNGTYDGESGTKPKKQFSRFNPVKVHPLWNYKGHTGNAVVIFNKDWSGFQNAIDFERHFELKRFGKEDWKRGKYHGLGSYGWIAREEDYLCGGPISEFLHKTGDLTTIAQLIDEEKHKQEKLVADLVSTIEAKSEILFELECHVTSTAMSLENMMTERERLQQARNREIEQMQTLNHEHIREIPRGNESLKSELSYQEQEQEHERRRKMLDREAARHEIDRRVFEEKREKHDLKDNSLQMATKEQEKAEKDFLSLVKKQEEEKKEALNNIIFLEKQLDHEMQLKIQQLRSKIQGWKHIGGEEIILEPKEIRRTNRTYIGVKRMREVDNEAIIIPWKEKNSCTGGAD